MSRPSSIILNFLILLFLCLLFSILQTTTFFWFFRSQQTFQFSLLVIIYAIVYRKPSEGLVFVYLAGYILALMSSMMESVSILNHLILYFSLRFFRNRVYSSGPVYFVWVSLASVAWFTTVQYFVAKIFEGNAPQGFGLGELVLELAITALVARPIYSLLTWIDNKSGRLAETELAG